MAKSPSAAIRSWLSTPEAAGFLEKISREILYEARRKSLSAGFLGAGIPLKHQAPDDAAAEIRSALVQWLLTHETAQEIVLHPSESRPDLRIKNFFIQHWIDKTRRLSDDRRRYLRARLLAVLNGSDRFRTEIREAGTVYTASADALGETPILYMVHDDLASIPFPFHLVPGTEWEEIRGKEHLLAIAAHFHDRITEKAGKGGRVRINDLIDWLGHHVDLGRPQSHLWEVVDEIPDLSPEAEPFDPDLVGRWAAMFAKGLKSRSAAVFFLRYCTREEMIFEKIARMLNYKGPSGPEYRLKSVEEKLKAFVKALPWLSPDPPKPCNEAAFFHFIEILCSILEKSAPEPYRDL